MSQVNEWCDNIIVHLSLMIRCCSLFIHQRIAPRHNLFEQCDDDGAWKLIWSFTAIRIEIITDTDITWQFRIADSPQPTVIDSSLPRSMGDDLPEMLPFCSSSRSEMYHTDSRVLLQMLKLNLCDLRRSVSVRIQKFMNYCLHIYLARQEHKLFNGLVEILK